MVDISTKRFVQEATELVYKAQQNGIIVRILGALAVYIHCMDNYDALKVIEESARLGEGKGIFTDLDLIAYSKQRKDIMKFLESMGFKPDRLVNALFATKRLLYYGEDYKIDIFFDKLEFSHDVIFGEKPGKGRLELDCPTISLADLVLEKLQIHQINYKDLVDLVAIFVAHDVEKSDVKDSIDGGYIARVLADDWGFWFDAVTNLDKTRSIAKELLERSILSLDNYGKVNNMIEKLRKFIEDEPKSKSWIKRAKIGTKKQWYRIVEELSR